MMTLPPQKFREAVFQILFSNDFQASEEGEIISMMMQELKTTRRNIGMAVTRVAEIVAKVEEIDRLIESMSTEYKFERISRAERTILRLEIFELLYDSSIPPKVAIAEGVRLCSKFGTPESSQFVNAILDGVYKNGLEAPAEPLPV